MNVTCPRHLDHTPSVTVYENGAYCHACSIFIPLDELGLKPEDVKILPRYVEDLDIKLSYIQTLPILPTGRGVSLPTDKDGYYLVWPDGSYYKLRRKGLNPKPKYVCPSGHTQPPLWLRRGESQTLLICEGEFDAISAADSVPEWDVMSPGGVGGFDRSLLTLIKPYATVVLALDSDKAGVEAARVLSFTIKVHDPGAQVIVLFKNQRELDFNDLYAKFGKEELRKEIHRLYTEVQGQSRG